MQEVHDSFGCCDIPNAFCCLKKFMFWSYISGAPTLTNHHFECPELSVKKSTKPDPASNRRPYLQPESLAKRDVFTDHSWAKWIFEMAHINELWLFYHAWNIFTNMLLASSVKNISSFLKQRTDKLKSPTSLCCTHFWGRQEMSDKKSWKGSMVRSNRLSTLCSV